MYDVTEVGMENIPTSDATSAEKDYKWKLWAANELQLRALLAHYILDGQISQFSGHPTCVRHTTNPLGLSSSETAFLCHQC